MPAKPEPAPQLTTPLPAFVTRGHPSYVWRRGQERRLALVLRHVPIRERAILDVGCGIGAWMQQFRRFSHQVYGVDIEPDRLVTAAEDGGGVACAVSERLPFRDDSFDLVFLHEVIEHVEDDRQTIREAVRCARPGGYVVIFAPNRLYPFETHGFFLGQRFVFRLLPLVNYLPDMVRNRFCPHVRIYTRRGIKRLFAGLDVQFLVCDHIWPGFDAIAARRPQLGALLQLMTDLAERTPLRSLGISHFVVARKRPAASSDAASPPPASPAAARPLPPSE